ncbi:MAG: hypothetical protein AAGG07_10730 [Planctomycetota bacterium]
MPPKTICPGEKLASISRAWDPAIVGSFMIDTKGTLNTGDAPSGELTRESLKRV